MCDEWNYLLGLRYVWLDPVEKIHAKNGIRAGWLRVGKGGWIERSSNFVTFKVL